jgi:hypothetical protein
MESSPETNSTAGTVLRSPEEWRNELTEYFALCRTATHRVGEANSENTLIAHQAEWHLRGLLHHMNRMLEAYSDFAREVGARAQLEAGPDALVMYAPSYQEVLFEFYALVNLARITLDNLRLFLRPVFRTPFGQLPKSVSGFLDGWTDCPVYHYLSRQAATAYLSDIRNCLVHFRTFATGDNALVIGDHVPTEEEERLLESTGWFRHMARARFRRVDRGVSVNVFLPDRIFDHSGTTEKLVAFTYDERINILSQAMSFVRLAWQSLSGSYSLLLSPGVPTYQFAKRPPVAAPPGLG